MVNLIVIPTEYKEKQIRKVDFFFPLASFSIYNTDKPKRYWFHFNAIKKSFILYKNVYIFFVFYEL